MVDDEIIDDPAVLGHDHRVTGPAEHHLGDAPHQRVIERLSGTGPGHLDLTHVGQIEDAGAAAHRMMLGEVGGVAQRHLPAAEIGEGGSCGSVDGVQGRGAHHGGLLDLLPGAVSTGLGHHFSSAVRTAVGWAVEPLAVERSGPVAASTSSGAGQVHVR